MVTEERVVEPATLRFTDKELNNDRRIQVHRYQPRPSRSSFTTSSADGPPCTCCDRRKSPIPMNDLRPASSLAGDSTPFGTPPLVIVILCPDATRSSKAESFAFAA